MDRQQAGNTYGNVTADGNTNVQLGDRSIKNYISIERAYITLQDELDLPQLHLLRNSQYGNLTIDGLNGALNVGRTSRYNYTRKRRHDGQGESQHQAAHEALCKGLSSTQQLPTTTSTSKPPAVGCDSSSSVTNASPQTQVVLNPGQSRAVYELLFTLGTILSCILGRNVSPDDLLHFVAKCQHDQLLPAMTFLLGISLYRYFSSRRLLQNPSCMSQERVTLEDAYGRPRLLSLDICGDFNVLKSFLESHYRETTAPTGEALVKAGQFNVILGSRRGNILHPSKWHTHRITSGSRIVNSVYMKSNDGKCFVCQKTLIVSELGDFHCLSCQTYHRDYDTLRDEETTPNQSLDTTEEDDSSFSTVRRSRAQRSGFLEADQFTVVGLKNLDIRILPRTTRIEPVTSAQAIDELPEYGSYHYGTPPAHYTKFYDSSSPHSSGEYVQYVPYQYDYATPVKGHRRRTSHTPVNPPIGGWFSPAGSPPPGADPYKYHVSPSEDSYLSLGGEQAAQSDSEESAERAKTFAKPKAKIDQYENFEEQGSQEEDEEEGEEIAVFLEKREEFDRAGRAREEGLSYEYEEASRKRREAEQEAEERSRIIAHERARAEKAKKDAEDERARIIAEMARFKNARDAAEIELRRLWAEEEREKRELTELRDRVPAAERAYLRAIERAAERERSLRS